MRVSTPVNNKHDNGAQTSLSIVAWYGRNYKTAFHNKIQQITKDSETSVKEEVSKLVHNCFIRWVLILSRASSRIDPMHGAQADNI